MGANNLKREQKQKKLVVERNIEFLRIIVEKDAIVFRCFEVSSKENKILVLQTNVGL